MSGDVEMWVENASFVPPGSVECALIGTAGERIALVRLLWKGELGGGPVEREQLRLTEVDADRRIRAVIWFDPDDRNAAFAEAQARFVSGEAAAIGGQAPIAALSLAIPRHDWETLRGCLAADAVVHDHRPLSLGELSPDIYVESLRVVAPLAPGWSAEMMRILAWKRHGRVAVYRGFGTLHDGGPFENFLIGVALTDRDRIQRYELFDVGDGERALAHFAELCAGLVERPPETLPR